MKNENGLLEAPPIEKTKKPAKSADVKIELPEFMLEEVIFRVRGTTPLIVNQFSNKAITQIRGKQEGAASQGKKIKVPDELYKDSLYFFKDGKRTGFPAVGFKAAMVRGAKQLSIPMTESRGKFHVMAQEGDLIEIIGEHSIRNDMVRIGNGSADVRWRGCYDKWEADVKIVYNSTVVSNAQLANMLRIAGFSCGIGEWRPERSNSGCFGLFEII